MNKLPIDIDDGEAKNSDSNASEVNKDEEKVEEDLSSTDNDEDKDNGSFIDDLYDLIPNSSTEQTAESVPDVTLPPAATEATTSRKSLRATTTSSTSQRGEEKEFIPSSTDGSNAVSLTTSSEENVEDESQTTSIQEEEDLNEEDLASSSGDKAEEEATNLSSSDDQLDFFIQISSEGDQVGEKDLSVSTSTASSLAELESLIPSSTAVIKEALNSATPTPSGGSKEASEDGPQIAKAEDEEGDDDDDDDEDDSTAGGGNDEYDESDLFSPFSGFIVEDGEDLDEDGRLKVTPFQSSESHTIPPELPSAEDGGVQDEDVFDLFMPDSTEIKKLDKDDDEASKPIEITVINTPDSLEEENPASFRPDDAESDKSQAADDYRGSDEDASLLPSVVTRDEEEKTETEAETAPSAENEDSLSFVDEIFEQETSHLNPQDENGDNNSIDSTTINDTDDDDDYQDAEYLDLTDFFRDRDSPSSSNSDIENEGGTTKEQIGAGNKFASLNHDVLKTTSRMKFYM